MNSSFQTDALGPLGPLGPIAPFTHPIGPNGPNGPSMSLEIGRDRWLMEDIVVSAWLEGFRNLDSETDNVDDIDEGTGSRHTMSKTSILSVSHIHNSDLSKALHVDDVIWAPALNRWIGRTSPRLPKRLR